MILGLILVGVFVCGYRVGLSDGRLEAQENDNFARLDRIIQRLREEKGAPSR